MRVKTAKYHKFVLLLPVALLLVTGLFIFALSNNSSLGNSNAEPAVGRIGGTEADNAGRNRVGVNVSGDDDIENVTGINDRDNVGEDGTKSIIPERDGGETNDDIKYFRVAGKQCAGIFTEDPAGISIEYGSDIYRYDIGEAGTAIISDCISDIDGDKTDEILVITGDSGQEYGSEFRILKLELTGGAVSISEINRIGLKAFNPWKVQTCDVDGDGTIEVSFGVYKTSRFHPVMAKRPFIYNLHENGISPKWRGSRLSRPFDDYIFLDINSDGADEIVSIECLADGEKAVNSYAWKGFGFESIGESRAYDNVLSISKSGAEGEGAQTIEACVIVDGQERWISLIHRNGMLSAAGDE